MALRKSEGKEVPPYFTEIVYVVRIDVVWVFQYFDNPCFFCETYILAHVLPPHSSGIFCLLYML
jgi:hypothetical protein